MKIRSALYSSLERVFPGSRIRLCSNMKFLVARNQRFSFQIAVRLESVPDDGEALPELLLMPVEKYDQWNIRIRRVGVVPVPHRNLGVPETDSEPADFYPGFIPDPLMNDDHVQLRPLETVSFWVSIRPEQMVTAGVYCLRLVLKNANKVIRKFNIMINVVPIVIQPRRNFFVTNWFYPDALMDYYQCGYHQETFWQILERYFYNLADHFQDTLYIPLFTPPLDGEKKNCQLLKIAFKDGLYHFDWELVRRYVQTAKKCGINHFEWCHLFSQWGAKYAAQVYDRKNRPLWPRETLGEDPVYIDFLTQLLPEWKNFCIKENILDCSFFHLSDEPKEPEHVERYCRMRLMISHLAPWIKVAEAFSERLAMQPGVIDLPIPNIAVAEDFIHSKTDCAVYFCCGPRGTFLQRLMDTPLEKIAMSGFLFYRFGVKGFLHWGANYWYRAHSQQLIDPFTVSDGNAPTALNWAHGDPFVIYPGTDGPIDSIRWEIFAEALQDYALLQTLHVASDELFWKDIQGFDRFRFAGNEINQLRKEVLSCR